MKELTLIGGSGFVGSAIRKEALARGYKVNAIVRNIGRLDADTPNMNVIKADVTDEERLVKLLQGTTNLISAFSPGKNNPNVYTELLAGYLSLMRATKRAGIKRILIVGGAGTLFVKPGVTVLDAGLIPDGVRSHARFYIDYLMKESDIDWVFFSPARMIVHGERTGIYRLGKDDLIVGDNGESRISVEDYAKAMIDELEQPSHHQERFTIGY